MPWIELAADISGVCSVAGTLLITSKPTSMASTKIVMSVSSSVVTRSLPPVEPATGADSASRAAVAGWITAPSWVMTTPAWISSPGSMASAPSFTRCSSSVAILRARKAEEAPGTVAARFPAPMMVTPFP